MWPALFAGALAAVVLLCACADNTDLTSRVRDDVNSVKQLTVPSDCTVTNSSGPTLGAYSANAQWEFETSEERRVYLSWVSQRLERDDFKLKSFDASSLDLTKSFRGEAHFVKIEATPNDRKLHVQITYIIDSD